jgi:2-amino-4-hydroxy-6-hydroxymethyldihydropteridine diphosphokinase
VTTIYLSLGSNLGDREANLRAALAALEAPDLHIQRVSPVYETEPVDLTAQPWFLNLAAEASTSLFPKQLLARLEAIEHRLGRRRTVPKGPRTIDLDILYYGNAVIESPELTIPHARLHERRFVLAPLADIAPGLRDPRTRRTVQEMLEDAPAAQAVRRVAEG